MDNHPTDISPSCEIAERYLGNNEVEPVSELLPAASARWYISRSRIEALFSETAAAGVNLETIFLCPCNRCIRDGGPIHDRLTNFNKLREKELRTEYAAIYALLIHVRRSGLIRVFQRHEMKLVGTRYLQDEDFRPLLRDRIEDLESLKKKVLREQYSFHVRILQPYSDIKVIPSRELLPINENPVPKGEGSFAEVRCFEFQDAEYRSHEFGQVRAYHRPSSTKTDVRYQITKFARKIFKNGDARSSAKEWYNLQGLSKATDHQHLMPALGAYWHGDIFFILQEEADMSLHDYLSNGRGDTYQPQELWKQVRGLAEGLNTLHRLYQGSKIAYHQDLKPANILIVKGTLKIADFGLLEFKPVLIDDSGSTGVLRSHNKGYYAPPRQGPYTRNDDIWSFACIISELATADIQGRDEIARYREARISNGQATSDTPAFFLGKKIKNSVLDKHTHLQRIVQTHHSVDDDIPDSFRRNFYNAEFFTLLNSMLRHGDSSGHLLAVPSQEIVPDAGKVADTLTFLRKAAMLDAQKQLLDFSPQIVLLDADRLAILMDKALTDFRSSLSRRDNSKFEVATVAELKQFIVDLQAKQCLERRQRGLKRLETFLKAFEQLEQLLRDYCESSMFMAFIWVRLAFFSRLVASR